MTDDRHQADDDYYIPTPKEVATKRGKRRHRRTIAKSTVEDKPKPQRRRRGGFISRVRKRATERRTEATAPRPSGTTEQIPDPPTTTETTAPISPEYQPATPQPTPTEEKPELQAEPEIPSSDTPSTEPHKGKRVRAIRIPRPDTAKKPAPKLPKPLPPEGRELATYLAEKHGHKLAPWESIRTLRERDETHWTKCNKCKLDAKATLYSQVASSSQWQYTGEALKVPCNS